MWITLQTIITKGKNAFFYDEKILKKIGKINFKKLYTSMFITFNKLCVYVQNFLRLKISA